MSGPAELPEYAEAVLSVVERIPPGRVLSYGDVAALVGRAGPRQVGRVMALWGGAVAWWRVVHADGRPALCHDGEARQRLLAEATQMHGDRVDLVAARWRPSD